MRAHFSIREFGRASFPRAHLRAWHLGVDVARDNGANDWPIAFANQEIFGDERRREAKCAECWRRPYQRPIVPSES